MSSIIRMTVLCADPPALFRACSAANGVAVVGMKLFGTATLNFKLEEGVTWIL
jgi:hypothetical protein